MDPNRSASKDALGLSGLVLGRSRSLLALPPLECSHRARVCGQLYTAAVTLER